MDGLIDDKLRATYASAYVQILSIEQHLICAAYQVNGTIAVEVIISRNTN
jgi:hypothetical protein